MLWELIRQAILAQAVAQYKAGGQLVKLPLWMYDDGHLQTDTVKL